MALGNPGRICVFGADRFGCRRILTQQTGAWRILYRTFPPVGENYRLVRLGGKPGCIRGWFANFGLWRAGSSPNLFQCKRAATSLAAKIDHIVEKRFFSTATSNWFPCPRLSQDLLLCPAGPMIWRLACLVPGRFDGTSRSAALEFRFAAAVQL